MSVAEVWRRLADVTTLEFEAKSNLATGWNGSGKGSVEVARPDATTMTFTESGSWTPTAGSDGRTLAFSNVYRWSMAAAGDTDDAILRLEHLRFGEASPVSLVELEGTAATHELLRSRAPHECGADRYAADLRVEADRLELRWTIRGPAKDEDVRITYR